MEKLVAEWKLVAYDSIASDALAPQDALDIASATTRRARSAPARSWWVPPVGALLCFGCFLLIGDTIGMLVDRMITLRGVGGIVVSSAFITFMVWVIKAWRSGGVVPRPLAEQPVQRWKRWILIQLPPFVGVTLLSSMPGWLNTASAVIMGVWMWFQLARPRVASWRN